PDGVHFLSAPGTRRPWLQPTRYMCPVNPRSLAIVRPALHNTPPVLLDMLPQPTSSTSSRSRSKPRLVPPHPAMRGPEMDSVTPAMARVPPDAAPQHAACAVSAIAVRKHSTAEETLRVALPLGSPVDRELIRAANCQALYPTARAADGAFSTALWS